MADIIVNKPLSGQQVVFTEYDDVDRILYAENVVDYTPEREGDNFVLNFDDGGQVVFEDFYVNYGSDNAPSFETQGTVFTAEDYFNLVIGMPDLMPALGPGQTTLARDASNRSFDDMSLLDGINRIGGLDLGFDDSYEIYDTINGQGIVMPGGTVNFDVWGPDGSLEFVNYVYEDGRPNQHLYGNEAAQNWGEILMSPQLNDGTSISRILMQGFHVGTQLQVRGADGNPIAFDYDGDGIPETTFTVTSPDQWVNFPPAFFEGEGQLDNLSGVFILPPADSDGDMLLNTQVTLTAPGGELEVYPQLTIVVDAVADLPEDLLGSVTDDGNDQHVMSVNTDESKIFDDGFNKIETSVRIGENEGSVPVSFAVTATFGDYLDGSEQHFILVAVNGSNGVTLSGEYVTVEVSGATYFRVPVDAAISEALTSGQQSYTTSDGYHVEFQSDGTVTVTAPVEALTSKIGSDTDFTVRTGALAVEDVTDTEVDLNNNISWNTDDERGTVTVNVDVVDSKLNVTMGWTSEGNAPEKDGKGTVHATSKEFEQNQLDSTDPGNYNDPDSGAGLEQATTGKGAPIKIFITGDADGSSPEHITSVTLDADLPTFDDGSVLGTFLIKGNPIVNGIFTLGSVTYTFDYNPAAGKLTITIDNQGDTPVTSLDDLNITFQPNPTPGTDAYYYDGDVTIDYQVTVQNDKGATGEYKGSGTVVIDAVADKSDDVTAEAVGTGDGGEGVADAVFTDTNAAHVNFNDDQKDGWFTDSFKSDNIVADYQLTVTVETQFKDLDGSEKHYVLVQDLSKTDGPQWSVDESALENLGYTYAGKYTGSDGNTYFQIEVTDESIDNNGSVSVEIPLIVTGVEDDANFSIKTGSVAEESTTSGLEYNKDDTTDTVTDSARTDNNIAENLANAVEYKVDVVNAGLTVKAGWASEGNNDYSHMSGPSSGYVSDGQPGAGVGTGVGQATLENDQDANQGAPIEVALTNAGGGEQIASITVSHNGDGSLYLEGTLLTSTMIDASVSFNGGNATVTYADGKYTITFPDSTTALSGNDLYYQPKAGSTNDDDVTLNYTVKVENGAGSTATFNGTTTVVIDAVANQPEVSIESDGTQVTYQNFAGTTDEQLAAKPGESVTLKGNVTFDDVDGSEDHVIYVQKVAGVEYDSITVGGKTYTTEDLKDMVSNDGKSYVFDVDDTTASFDVTIVANASPTTDAKYTIEIKGEATEKGYTGADGYTGPTDHEYDTNNNSSSKSATLSFEVAPAEAGKIAVVNTYEDQMHDQHVGKTTTNATWGNITFGTSDTEKDEYISEISITVTGDALLGIGTLQYGGNTLTPYDGKGTLISSQTIGTTTFTYSENTSGQLVITITDNNDGSLDQSLTVKFVPAENSDTNFNFDYKITTVDPESGHSQTNSGNGSVKVDAVADMPKDLNAGDAKPHYAIDPDDTNAAAKAKPGEEVKVTVDSVIFNDYADGSESHYLYIADSGTSSWNLANLPNQTITLTGKDSDGNSITQTIVIASGKAVVTITDGNGGVVSSYDLTQAEYNDLVAGTTGSGSIHKIPVHNDFLQLTADGSVSAEFTINAPNAASDNTYTIKVGAGVTDTEVDDTWTNTGLGQNYNEVTNNTSKVEIDLTIMVGAVTSAPKFGITDIYEDTDANAHLPMYDVDNPPSGMTLDAYGHNTKDPNYVNDPARDHQGAKITVTGMHTSESARYFFIIKGEGGRALDLSNHEPGDGMTITVGGVDYPVQYVAGIGYVAGVLDAAGVFQPGIPVDGASSITFVLDPGTDYNSEDLHIDWVVEITDKASGSQEIHTSLPSGADTNTIIGELVDGYDSATYEPGLFDQPGMNVTVDAVAQRPDMELEGDPENGLIHSDGKVIADADKGTAIDNNNDGRYDFVEAKQGQEVYISATVEFKDVYDGSERHYFLVEAKPGWTPPTSVILYDADGNVAATIPITSVAKQSYDGTLYYKFEISNDDIQKYDIDPETLGGQLHVEFVLTAPANPLDTTFKVGSMSWEDYNQLGKASSDNNELILNNQTVMQNNTAYNIVEEAVHVQFAKVGGLTLTPQNKVFENNTPFAHKDDPAQPGSQPLETEGNPAVISVNLGGNDKVVDFKITNMGEINEAGALVYKEGGTTYQIDSEGRIVDGGGYRLPSNNGQFEFTPGKNYSDADVDIKFSGTVQSNKTGETNSVGGTVTVVVDAVAQMPAAVSVPEASKEIDADYTNGLHTFTLTINAKFDDIEDGSEKHYVLVEAKANMTVAGSEGTFTIYDQATGKYVTYFKVPVNPDDIKADGTVTVDVQVSIGHLGEDNPGTIRTGALAAEETLSDSGEITYHNNTAFTPGGTVEVDYGKGGGGVWVEGLYENNTPDANVGDYTQVYGKVNGLAETAPDDTDVVRITLPRGVLVDSSDPNTAVEYPRNEDGSYTISRSDLDKIFVKLPENDYLDLDLSNVNNAGLEYEFFSADSSGSRWTIQGNPSWLILNIEHGQEPDLGGTLSGVWQTINGEDMYVINKGSDKFSEALANPSKFSLPDGVTELRYVFHAGSSLPSSLKDVEWEHWEKKSESLLSGEAAIVVDAVAQQPTGPEASVNYGDDYTAMGAAGNQGNEGTCTIIISGTFQEDADSTKGGDDHTEKHYALIEHQPGFIVEGADTVYLNGKSYYKVEMAKDAAGNYLLDENGKEYAEVTLKVSDPKAINLVDGHTLETGLLVEEGPTDLEERADNNISWTLGGEAEIKVSFVESTLSVTVGNGYEDGLVGINLSGSLGANDVFNGFTLNHNGEGQFVVTDSNGVGGWLIDGDGNLVITDFNAVGKIQVQYKPEAESGDDVTWNWEAGFTDTLSGDTTTPGGSGTIIIDAVATDDVHAANQGSASDSGHALSASGKEAVVSVTLTFDDLDGSETHYAVIEQDARWPLTSVTIEGTTCTLPSSDITVTTIYNDAGKPYHAVLISDALLGANGGKVDVQFTLQAPTSSSDFSHKLSVGGITVEDNNGTGSNKELNLSNNWGESLQDVTVGVAEVQATTIKVAADQTNMEEDSGMMKINFSVTDGNNDSIKDVTIKVPVGGIIIVDGQEYSSGSVTITAADLNNVYFQPNKDWSGTVNLDITAGTLIDNNSGAEKAAATLTDGSFSVLGVADAPTDAAVDNITDAEKVKTEHAATFTAIISSALTDTDSSETLYILIEQDSLPTGVSFEGTPPTVVTINGTTYYQIATSNGSASITFKVTEDYAGDDIVAYSASKESTAGGVAPSVEWAINGNATTITVPIIPELNSVASGMSVEENVETLTSDFTVAGLLEFSALFADDEGDAVTLTTVWSSDPNAAQDISTIGGIDVQGEYGTLHIDSDGYYTYTANAGTVIPADAEDTFHFGGTEDGYGDVPGSGSLVFTFAEATQIGSANDDVLYGADATQLYGGAGNDILVYSADNTVMDGGDGIDFLIASGNNSLDDLLSSGIINNMEVIVTGDDAVGLTSLDKLSNVGLGINGDKVTVDDSMWDKSDTVNEHGYFEYTYSGDNPDLDMTIFVMQNSLGG